MSSRAPQDLWIIKRTETLQVRMKKDAGVGTDVGRVSPQGRNPTAEVTAETSGYAALT